MIDSHGEHGEHGEHREHDAHGAHEEPPETPLTGEEEPPPVGPWSAFNLYSSPVPFGGPPAEPVEIDGEVPWELRDDPDPDPDSDEDKNDETAR
jgi:hypothetical protein